MAAIRLLVGSTHRASVFDIVATSDRPDFIDHLGILKSAKLLSRGLDAMVFEMGPPIRVGQCTMGPDPGDTVGTIQAHAIGWIEDLDVEEAQDMALWLEDVRTRISNNQYFGYSITPPFVEEKDKDSDRVICQKFSCAGFILQCYEQGAGIVLLHSDPAVLPAVDRSVLEQIYDKARMDLFHRAGRRFGITGQGPWQIVLCGYVLHALNRSAASIRHSPYIPSSVEEAAFPSG